MDTYFGKIINRPHERLWRWVTDKIKFDFSLGDYSFKGFEFVPDCYFLLELDMNFSGYGSYSTKEDYTEYSRSILHFVIFRTKFGIRKTWSVYK